jgi:hypothetical protein
MLQAEDGRLHNHRCENLKSYKNIVYSKYQISVRENYLMMVTKKGYYLLACDAV